MANLELVFNPKKFLRRNDLIKLGEMIADKVKSKKIDGLIIKITDDMVGGENSMSFPFRIIDEKAK